MKEIKLHQLSLLILSLSVANSTLAANTDNAVVTINQEVTAKTCTLTPTDIDQNIALTPTNTISLLNASNIQQTTFSFGLSDCVPSYTKATVTIGGTTEASDTAYTTVIRNTGTASNVGIGFLGATSVGATPGGELPVGTASAFSPITNNTTTIYLSAAVVPLVKAIRGDGGTVVATATATFTYS